MTGETDALQCLLPQVVEVARRAGSEILELYQDPNCAISYKKDRSPITEADLASHRTIAKGLSTIAPELPLLSEESSPAVREERHAWKQFWMFDPLDGTQEFVSRNGEFTVNIALIHNSAPILGVIYAPVVAEMYFAAQGVGAFKEIHGCPQRISVSPTLGTTRRIVISRSHSSSKDHGRSSALDNCAFLKIGSSLKFCLVADGRADIYPRSGPTMEWDTAAGQCVLEQAGGSVVDEGGSPLLYNKITLQNPGFIARSFCIYRGGI